ncbi:hypothetical protein ACTFIU_005618 [Dictyostelium citrinum]
MNSSQRLEGVMKVELDMVILEKMYRIFPFDVMVLSTDNDPRLVITYGDIACSNPAPGGDNVMNSSQRLEGVMKVELDMVILEKMYRIFPFDVMVLSTDNDPRLVITFFSPKGM